MPLSLTGLVTLFVTRAKHEMTCCHSFCEFIMFSAVNKEAENILLGTQTPSNLLDIHIHDYLQWDASPLELEKPWLERLWQLSLWLPQVMPRFWLHWLQSPLKALTETATKKLCHIQGSKWKGYADGGGEERGGGGSFLTGCCLFLSQTAGPDPLWSHQPKVHFQLASGNSSHSPVLADAHWPLRGAEEQISGSWWYGLLQP